MRQWKAKNNLKDLKDAKDQARKYLKAKNRRRFLKKKVKKQKKGKRKKKGGKKKRKGGKKKKGMKKKGKLSQAKVSPMPLPGFFRQNNMSVDKSALELLDQSCIPLESAILDSANYEDDNDF